MNLAHYDAPTLRCPRHPQAYAALAFNPRSLVAAEPSWRVIYERVRRLPPGFWHAPQPASPDAPTPAFALRGRDEIDDTAVAAEVQRALEHGSSSATPRALLLLAVLALRHDGEHADALRLARTALDVDGGSMTSGLHPHYAALVTPLAAAFDQAVCELVALCEDGAPASASLYLAGAAHVAGMPLPELVRRHEPVGRVPAGDDQRTAAAELRVRMRVLGTLLHGERPAPDDGAAALPHGRFGYWLAVLQEAWYAGDQALALQAVDRANRLAGTLVPPADRLCFDLFAALVLAQDTDRKPDAHCAALRRMARHYPRIAANHSLLADAAHAGRHGDALAALRGYEEAAEAASRCGQHWMAALAWEGAARQAQHSGLATAVSHYRRSALASYGYWGALGRIAALQQRWNDPAVGGGGQALRQPLLGVGGAGELGLSIAHEINQPLAAISLHAAAARKWLRRAQPDVQRALSSIALIGDAGRHAGDIVRSMQRLAARQGSEMGQVLLDQVIGDVLQLLQGRLRKDGIAVELALELGECPIRADRTQVQQVLTNLLVNAIEALRTGSAVPGGRRIRVSSCKIGAAEVEVRVADNGPGIAPHHRERVFGSLFSTKPESTGMGLAISLAIVRAHGGWIDHVPAEPHGACFRFRLPIRQRAGRLDGA